jgi:hypothetical protein
MIASFLLILLLGGSYTSSPEDFLDSLCIQRQGLDGARFWLQSAWEDLEGPLSDTDSMRVFLESLVNLSVDPGHRILSGVDESSGRYSVEYPGSVWTWKGADDRMYRTAGLSVIIWCDGHFYWQTLPVIGGQAVGVGLTERIITAIFFTIMLLIFGMLILIWVKRKYTV